MHFGGSVVFANAIGMFMSLNAGAAAREVMLKTALITSPLLMFFCFNNLKPLLETYTPSMFPFYTNLATSFTVGAVAYLGLQGKK